MNERYLKRYYEEADDSGGGTMSERSRGLAALGEIPPKETVDDPPVEEKVTPTPPAQVVDAGELAKSFGAVLKEHFTPPAAPEKKVDDLTPEEAKKLLNVWEPTKEWLARYDNLETREAAIAEQRDGLVKHVDTISQFRVRQAVKDMEKEYAPVRKYVEEARERETTDRFNKRYSVFADPALAALRDTVAGNLQKNGKTYSDEAGLFDDIAKGMEAVIKVTNPEFKLPSAGSSPAEKTKPKSQSSLNGIPVTTPGAGGGTAARTTPVTKKRGLSIFD